MASPVHESFLPAMSAIAREAGALLLPYFHQGLKIEYKGDADLVTAADRASETLIRERISKQFPSHDVLGEEQGLNDRGGDYRWYVDPLDGTTNFAHGYPVFCVSMALEHRSATGQNGLPESSTIRRVMNCSRRRREEARISNGKPIHVSKATQLKECLVATGFPSHKRHKNPNIHFYHQITLRTHGVRRAGFGRAGLVQRGLRAVRWLLGIQSQSLGHGGGCAHRRRSRRQGEPLRRLAV